LLVFEQRDSLHEHLREGVPLRGNFSPEIIASIFTNQSPIHDGAAVIKGDRITLVGAYLPLTRKKGLPQHFGTRHRAAIGLSEVSDAVILVVSEERSEVSVVHKGEVELIKEPWQLHNTLEHHHIGTDPEAIPRTRRRELLSQAGGLLLTFLLVSTFWGIYSGKQLSLINVTTTVDFRNIPENLELKRSSAEKVEIQITGKRRLVGALRPEQVRAFLDLDDVEAGLHRQVLNAENIELPLGLEVVRITPSVIRVDMERRIEKMVAVEPEATGSPPIGYFVERISVSPGSVKISGPVSILRHIVSLPTEPVAVSDIDPQIGKKTVEVPVVLSPPSLRLVVGQDKKFLVTIHLKQESRASAASE
jgi:YbbR domain-containing protein